MKKKDCIKYPGVEEAERERDKGYVDEEPDMLYPGVPNYDKFKGWSTEEVLVWLNID